MRRVQAPFRGVMQALLEFALRPQNARGLEQASQEYFGTARLQEVEGRDVDYLAFLEWVAFDRPPGDDQGSLVETFLEVKGTYSGRNRDDLARWARTRISFHQVLRIHPRGVLVSDLLAPEPAEGVFVCDPPPECSLACGDLILARVLPWQGRYHFGGTVNVFAPSARSPLVDFLHVIQARIRTEERDVVLRSALPLLARGQAAAALEQEPLFPGGYPDRLTPDTLEALIAHGRSCLARGEYSESLLSFQRALFEDPRDVVARNGAGLAYLGRGDFIRARRAFESILEGQPDCAMALLNLGNLELCCGNTDRAVNLLDRARRSARDEQTRVQASLNMGVAQLEQGHVRAARRCFREACQRAEAVEVQSMDGVDVNALHFRVASALSARHDWRSAAPYLRRIVHHAPDSGAAHLCLAEVYLHLGHPMLAAREFRQALALGLGGGRAWNALGKCYGRLGRWRLAEEAFRHAVELLPGLADAHENLGRAIMEQNRLEEAQARFKTALRHAPSSPEALLGAGEVHRRMRDYKASLRYIRRAVRVAPDHSAARCLLEQVEKERSLCT